MIPIDSAATLQRINHDTALLNEQLSLFMTDLPDWQKKLLTTQQPVVFAQYLHQLKGICQYLTMPQLALYINDYEHALKHNNGNTNIMQMGQTLSHELKRILDYYHEHIQSTQ